MSSTLRFIVPKADSEASIGDPCGERELPPLARRGEVAAPLQALVAFSNRFLLRAPAHPSWPGLPWFQPPSPAAAAAGGTWQPAHLKGVWEGPATIQVPVLSRLTLFCRRRALFHFWR